MFGLGTKKSRAKISNLLEIINEWKNFFKTKMEIDQQHFYLNLNYCHNQNSTAKPPQTQQ